MHNFMNSSLPVLSVHAPGIDETIMILFHLPALVPLAVTKENTGKP